MITAGKGPSPSGTAKKVAMAGPAAWSIVVLAIASTRPLPVRLSQAIEPARKSAKAKTSSSRPVSRRRMRRMVAPV
jgi:hypothetical protein